MNIFSRLLTLWHCHEYAHVFLKLLVRFVFSSHDIVLCGIVFFNLITNTPVRCSEFEIRVRFRSRASSFVFIRSRYVCGRRSFVLRFAVMGMVPRHTTCQLSPCDYRRFAEFRDCDCFGHEMWWYARTPPIPQFPIRTLLACSNSPRNSNLLITYLLSYTAYGCFAFCRNFLVPILCSSFWHLRNLYVENYPTSKRFGNFACFMRAVDPCPQLTDTPSLFPSSSRVFSRHLTTRSFSEVDIFISVPRILLRYFIHLHCVLTPFSFSLFIAHHRNKEMFLKLFLSHSFFVTLSCGSSLLHLPKYILLILLHRHFGAICFPPRLGFMFVFPHTSVLFSPSFFSISGNLSLTSTHTLEICSLLRPVFWKFVPPSTHMLEISFLHRHLRWKFVYYLDAYAGNFFLYQRIPWKFLPYNDAYLGNLVASQMQML